MGILKFWGWREPARVRASPKKTQAVRLLVSGGRGVGTFLLSLLSYTAMRSFPLIWSSCLGWFRNVFLVNLWFFPSHFLMASDNIHCTKQPKPEENWHGRSLPQVELFDFDTKVFSSNFRAFGSGGKGVEGTSWNYFELPVLHRYHHDHHCHHLATSCCDRSLQHFKSEISYQRAFDLLNLTTKVINPIAQIIWSAKK